MQIALLMRLSESELMKQKKLRTITYREIINSRSREMVAVELSDGSWIIASGFFKDVVYPNLRELTSSAHDNGFERVR